MKTESWNGHSIRFVEHNGEWWAVARDVARALGFSQTAHMVRMVDALDKDTHKVDTTSEKTKCPETQDMLIMTEFGIYQCVFNSHRPQAKVFKRWVYDVLKELRAATGLEGFEAFRLLDREHQKQAMRKLCDGLKTPSRIDFIKANTIANKAVSSKHGCPKTAKKGEMTPSMLKDRERVLENVVELMAVKDKYGLDISVSEQIYKRGAP